MREESDGDKFWVLTIYMEKPEIPVWKNKWFAPLHLGSFRKYELLFEAMQFFYSFFVNFADMEKMFSGSFSHHVKF